MFSRSSSSSKDEKDDEEIPKGIIIKPRRWITPKKTKALGGMRAEGIEMERRRR
jgi:hypothetical protein